ncbi:ATP:cob(I)alamin adenosyltransferase [Dongshaea marina]|uniref:ATP:cob(I)alamin adenosyltransferase n=1 Tax=Dongshaea marina TaxID=2047966 RepID=UPI000D3E25E4|nr:ATP:cob(I)alamin adenosyltransferase [Dongshaea marina]
MSDKRKRALAELCYPFMKEQGGICDFEMLTDELCSGLGMVLARLSELPGDAGEIRGDLDKLQLLIYHLNGSVRGRCGIFEEDLEWLHQRYAYYQELTRDCVGGFVLPRGETLGCTLHLCRCQGKKVVRQLHRLLHDEVQVAPILLRFSHLVTNFLFVLTLRVNMLQGFKEVPFISISYG